MPTRKASAQWSGGLRTGQGSFLSASAAHKTGTMRRAAIAGAYNFSSRFEEAPGTNPEELIAAAEAACYTMTLCAALESAGKPVSSVQTEADCTIEDVPEVGYTITHLRLTVRALVPGLDVESFARAAEITRARCTVSRALAGVLIDLDAALA